MTHLGITDWLMHDDLDMKLLGIDDQLRPDALKHR